MAQITESKVQDEHGIGEEKLNDPETRPVQGGWVICRLVSTKLTDQSLSLSPETTLSVRLMATITILLITLVWHPLLAWFFSNRVVSSYLSMPLSKNRCGYRKQAISIHAFMRRERLPVKAFSGAGLT